MADYTVVRAYEENVEVFRIDRMGSTLAVIPKKFDPDRVDKLVFFDGSQEIRFVVPLLRDTLEFEVTANGIRLDGSVRAYLLGGRTQFLSLALLLRLRNDGTPELARFAIEEWARTGPATVTLDAIDKVSFVSPPLRGPAFAERIGLTIDKLEESTAILTFHPTFVFNVPIQLSSNRQTLIPFGLPFSPRNLIGNRTMLRIRQPRIGTGDRNDPLAWPADHWIVEIEIPGKDAILRWNEAVVAPYVRALHTVQDGRPVSLLPEIPPSAGNPWIVKLSLIDRVREKHISETQFIVRETKEPVEENTVGIFARTVEPGATLADVPLAMPAFRTTSEQHDPLRLVCTLSRPEPEAETDLLEHNEGFHFKIAHTKTAHEQTVRVGALDLVFRPIQALHLDEIGTASVSFRTADVYQVPRVERLDLVLGAIAIRPGNQDPIPGEEFNESSLAFSDPKYDAAFRRAAPLVIDLDTRPPTAHLVLKIEESAIERESQTITMKLTSPQPSPQDVDAIVIDSAPFLIARVQVDNSRTPDETPLTAEIGNWSNRSADLGWEMSSAAAGFDLVLPPQGIGESMEKREGDFLDENGGIAPGDFRFSPNARFRLRSSWFQQRFVEVPWNLRRVLGYPGQRAAGAGVKTLDFELVYGLSAHVENERLRLAEIAARLGHLPGRQSPSLPWKASNAQIATYKQYRERWKDQFPSLLSRLAILEPYQTDREGTLALGDADGVTYELREQADLADPLHRDPPVAPFFKPEGLRGGWAWGFESANILEAVLRAPRSSSAVLARPFFSALGGWGYQKASFDRNLSTIYSDTAMGRTFSISIERIGRVSVLWNRAKHVIVYERTVMPTRQFAGEQDLLLGIPVLRKVREYVEILQPDRSYPEFGEAPLLRGFIRGSAFPEGSLRINVSSAWGEDVGRIGWKVPLWKSDADPVVYPRPLATLRVAGDHPDKIVPLTLSEPDKFYFFTNTEASQPPNSDLWPAVEGIDYQRFHNFAIPQPRFGVGTPAENTVPYPPVLAGNGAFTFAVDPSPHATDIVHERTDSVVGAILQNVTLARGPLQSESAGTTVTLVRDVLHDATRTILAEGVDLDKLKGTATAEIRKVRTELEALVGNLDRNALCARLEEVVRQELDRATTANGAVVPIVEQLRAVLHTLQANVEAELRRVRAAGTALDADARKTLQRAREQVRENASVALRSVQGAAGGAARAVRFAVHATREVRADVADKLGDLQATIGAATEWTDALRRDVRESAAITLERISRVESALDDASRLLTGPIPNRLRVFSREVIVPARRIAERIVAATNAQVTLLPQRLKAEVAERAVAIDAGFQIVEDELRRLEQEIQTRFATTPLEIALDRIDDDLEAAIANAGDWEALLDLVQARFDALFAEADALIEQQIARLRELVAARAQSLCASLPDLSRLQENILASLDQAGDALEETLQGLEPTAADAARAVERMVSDAARQLTDLASAAGKAVAPITTSIERGFRLIRAFGEVPRVPGLGFDASRIAYHFADVIEGIELPDVSLSPVIAKANQLLGAAAEALSPFTTAIPSVKLLDRIVPADLQNFDLAGIFPNFAGLKLDGLFSNIRMPKLSNEHVRVTHGFDQQSMRGWVQVDADVPFEQTLTVLSIVGVTLTLVGARFRATSRIEAQPGQSPQHTFFGEIHGEWRLDVGGFDLVSFVDTRLRFDDRGNIRFDVSPDKIKLQAVLSFVSDLMAGFGYSDSGFSIRVMPTGIQSTLDLPLPDIQGGAFGLSNLRLGAQFALEFPEFAIATRFFIGQKKAPFTITIFVLGGAGWVDARVRYLPKTGVFQTKVSVGITAAASLAIALGPIKGGVHAYFGINVEYESETGGVNDLRIGLLLLFRGEVSLLGFLSVTLCLALEAMYTPSGGLIGRGHVSYSIKICWCVKINVSSDVSYTFGSGGSRAIAAAHEAPPSFLSAATEYVDMFV